MTRESLEGPLAMFRVLLDCLKAEAGDPVKEAQTFKQLDLTAKAWLRARVR